MSELVELPRREVGSGTGLHDHRAGWQIAEEPHHLQSREFLAKYRPACPILTMQMEAVLAEIDTHQCNFVHGDGLRDKPSESIALAGCGGDHLITF
ncbi:hypothetical protein D3C85_1595060 [compost metagenome]